MEIQKALKIINEHDIYTASQFGRLYFEGQPILKRCSNIGNGATKGVGAWFVSGRILKSLKDKGLISGGVYSVIGGRYILTEKGNKLIDLKVKEE